MPEAAGDLGEVYYGRARSIRRSGIPVQNLGFIQQGGGAFRDMGVHVLDAAWSIMGRPRPVTVSAVGGARFGPRGQGYSGSPGKHQNMRPVVEPRSRGRPIQFSPPP